MNPIMWFAMTVPFILSLIIWNGLVYCLFMLGMAFFGFLMCGRTAYHIRGNFPSHTALTSEGIKFVDGSKFNHGAVYMFPFQDIVSIARVTDSPALCQLVLANPVSSYLQEPPLGRTRQSNTNKIQIKFLENVTMLIIIAMALKKASSSAPTHAVPLGGNMSQVAATVVSTRNGPVTGNIQTQMNQWVESLRSDSSVDTVA
ncbi:hypothetical protein MPSEU_000657200 [Mayamaea pseudoterrestris]|nr:hypothetical protein MPSEU_000657200 [Mayamaea pseudoterrestris]